MKAEYYGERINLTLSLSREEADYLTHILSFYGDKDKESKTKEAQFAKNLREVVHYSRQVETYERDEP